MNIEDRHRAMVRRLKKPAEHIHADLTADNLDAMHMALGLAGESGEVVDMIKKAVINGHELPADKLREEIGDVLFYLQGLCMVNGITLTEALAHNLLKLEKRYPEGYSDQASVERVDESA